MAKFQEPPLRTDFHKLPPTKEKPGGVISEGWQRFFVAVTNRLTQPNTPVVIVPPTTGKAGDIRVHPNFLFVCVQDNVWKKVPIS
jgi:hypothetical protein